MVEAGLLCQLLRRFHPSLLQHVGLGNSEEVWVKEGQESVSQSKQSLPLRRGCVGLGFLPGLADEETGLEGVSR